MWGTRRVISRGSSPCNDYPPVPDCRPGNRLTIFAGIFFARVPKSCKRLQFTDLPSELLSMMVLPEPVFTTIYSVSLCKKDSKVLWLFLPGGRGGEREGSVLSPLKYADEDKSQSQKAGARTFFLDSKSIIKQKEHASPYRTRTGDTASLGLFWRILKCPKSQTPNLMS